MDEQDASGYHIDQVSRAGSTASSVPDASALPATTANRWLRILQYVTEGAITHLDLEGLLHELLGRISAAMEADNAAILLLSADGAYLTLYAARGSEETMAGQVQVPMGHGVAGVIAARRTPLIIDDLAQMAI